MSENQQVSRPSIASRELLGMVLFTASAFPLVLVAMALAKGQTDSTGGTAAIAHGIVGAVGFLPALVAAGGFAVIGAAMALSGKDLEVGRHLGGFLFTALGLAVCLGALHPAGEGQLHGGALGDATGGALLALGPWAGLVIGGAVAFSAVWLAWLGGLQQTGARFQRNGGQTPTISDALSERDADGVSSAEANALVPDEATLSYMEELWSTNPAPQLEPIPPSPYPEDVRLAGKVPEGAAVLALDDDEQQAQSEAHDGANLWRPPEANRPAEHGVGGDLAGDTTLVQAVPGGEAREPASDPQAGLTTGDVRILENPGRTLKGPPVPAWEQPAMFAGEPAAVEASEEVEEEPVADLAPEAPAEEEAAELEEEEDEDEDEEYEDEEEAAEYEEEDEEEEGEEAAELDGEDEEEEEEDEEAAEYEDEDEEAAELDDEEEEEDDEEEEEAAEYEEDEEDEEDEEEAAELEDGEEEAEDEEEEDEEAAELDDEEEEEDLDEEEAAEYEEEDEDEEELVAEVEDPSPEPEPEVVLQPAAPPEGADASDAAAVGDNIVQEAGHLFLTHGRVAVSLLQRRFALEFDDACEVLDQLQELGLIGPYLGGQKRDILMTAEEWDGRLAGS